MMQQRVDRIGHVADQGAQTLAPLFQRFV